MLLRGGTGTFCSKRSAGVYLAAVDDVALLRVLRVERLFINQSNPVRGPMSHQHVTPTPPPRQACVRVNS